jgi:ribosome-associated protein
MMAAAGIRRSRYSERKWSLATSVLSKSVLPKSASTRTRKTSTQAAALKAQSDADKTLKMILSRLEDMKAEETVTIDLRGKSAFSDYMIVTSGRANRHVGAIAENVVKGLKETGIKGIHIEGLPNCDWVLIDSGDVIVHVFRPEIREFYNLERLWTQNPAAAKAI